MLYFSYGMNTNLDQMAGRCPTAVSLGKATLLDYRFEFKRHATVEFESYSVVSGVLWEITKKDERSLDVLEGFPIYYYKKDVKVLHNGKYVTAMTYLMDPSSELGLPTDRYYDMLIEGYEQHDISTEQLDLAVKRAARFEELYQYN